MLLAAGMVLGACSRDRLDEPDLGAAAGDEDDDRSAGDNERVDSEELSDIDPVPAPTTEGPTTETSVLRAPTTSPPAGPTQLTVELVLDELRVEDVADLWPAQHDEVALGVVATDAAGATTTRVVEVGKLAAGEEVEPGLTLASFDLVVPSGEEQVLDVQLIAIELDSDGFDGVLDELERLAGSVTGSDPRPGSPRLSSETLDELRRDDGLLVNDNDLIGSCWTRATLHPNDDELVTSVGVAEGCVAEDVPPGALLFFSGEGGAWSSEVTWLVTGEAPAPQPPPTTAPPTTAAPTTTEPATTTAPPPAPPTVSVPVGRA